VSDDPLDQAKADPSDRGGKDDPSDRGQPDDPSDRREFLRLLLGLGATPEEVAASTNLGELALDLQLRPRSTATLREIVDSTDLDWKTARPLLMAAGLPGEEEAAVTADEAESIRLLAISCRELLGETSTLQLARVLGNSASRIAETLVGAVRLQVELPRRDAGVRYVDLVEEYCQMARTLMPPFVGTLDALLRRQIVAVADRMWSTDEDRSAVTLPRTVGFVDLVGYTEATATSTVRELTRMLMEFDMLTSEAVSRGNGQIVKTIGDEAMFVTERASDACSIALELVGSSGSSEYPVRVGLASGDMVSVLGDLYGPDVNVAARLVAVAEPSGVVVSEQVASSSEGFRFEVLPPLELKGIPGTTRAFRLVARDS
jgi:adenylate cyclase